MAHTLLYVKADQIAETDKQMNALEALSSKGPILILFHHPSCGPCKRVKPHLKTAAKKEGIHLVTVQISTKRFDQVADRFNVTLVPTVIALYCGSEVCREQPNYKKDVKEFMEKALRKVEKEKKKALGA